MAGVKVRLRHLSRLCFLVLITPVKRDDYVNEKRRFKPWQGGLYGGSLAFEIDNKQYTIYRTFEAKDKDDTFKLVDTITKLDSFDYTSDIGKEIFEIDSDSFEKTAYIFQNNCESRQYRQI